MNLFEDRQAIFSSCSNYRYYLSQIWNKDLKPICFLMLNPSKADEIQNDPTVERCERRARNTRDCGGVIITNIFALRSTDPSILYSHPSPIGQENDKYILQAAFSSSMVVCAWGVHGKIANRGHSVLRLLLNNGITPYVLKVNKDGYPAHPLYISYSISPTPYTQF